MKQFAIRNFVPFALALIMFLALLPFIESAMRLYNNDYEIMVTLHCDDNSTPPDVVIQLEEKDESK